jgi:hypothetical protein
MSRMTKADIGEAEAEDNRGLFREDSCTWRMRCIFAMIMNTVHPPIITITRVQSPSFLFSLFSSFHLVLLSLAVVPVHTMNDVFLSSFYPRSIGLVGHSHALFGKRLEYYL